MRKFLSIATGVAVAAALMSAAPAGADPGRQLGPESFPLSDTSPRAAANQGVLVAQRATLTEAHRMQGEGFPKDQTHRLSRANVTVEVAGDPPASFIRGSNVVLGAAATEDLYVYLGFGHRSGTQCVVNKWFRDRLWPGDRVAEFHSYGETGPKPWDCVAARSVHYDDGTDIDALVGLLTNTYQKPNLQIGRVSLLGQNQKKRLKLVRGVPTTIDVVVRNRGKVAARNVVLGGNGKRLQVGRARINEIAPGKVATLSLKVRIRGKKKPGKLRLVAVARAAGAKAARRLNVRRVKPPRRPRAGTYRNKGGSVRFTIRKGRVIGWRGTMQTTCGGYGTLPQYTQNTYDFKRVKIPRNGIVQARQRGKNHSAHLQMRVVGGKVTRGRFSYFGPGTCRASISFNATRVRR